MLEWLAIVVVSYLLGSVPSGLLIGRAIFGIDVRDHGSRRTGATNVLRTIGTKAALAVTVMDIAKGVVAIQLARSLMPNEPWAHVAAALAAIAGHNWPVFIGFRGGRGVIVALSALGLLHLPTLLIVVTFGVAIIWWTRFVSLGSVAGAAIAPLVGLAFYVRGDLADAYLIYMLLGGALIVVTHRDNIRRLQAGTENRLGQHVTHAT